MSFFLSPSNIKGNFHDHCVVDTLVPWAVFHSVFSHLENMLEMFSVASVSLFLILLGFSDQCQFIEHSCKMHSRPAEAAMCKKKQKTKSWWGFLEVKQIRGADQKTKSKEQKGKEVLVQGNIQYYNYVVLA